jgi:hypothetical protein
MIAVYEFSAWPPQTRELVHPAQQVVGLPGRVRAGQPVQPGPVRDPAQLRTGLIGTRALRRQPGTGRPAGVRELPDGEPAFRLEGQHHGADRPDEAVRGGAAGHDVHRVPDRRDGGGRPERHQQRQAGAQLEAGAARTGGHHGRFPSPDRGPCSAESSVSARSRSSNSRRSVQPSRCLILAMWCSTVFAER